MERSSKELGVMRAVIASVVLLPLVVQALPTVIDGIDTRGFEQPCNAAMDVSVETHQRDLVTQGDARWVLEEGARSIRARCPILQSIRWQINLRGRLVQDGVFDKGGRSGMRNLDTQLSMEMSQNYKLGRWRPSIEAERRTQQEATAAANEQQQREAEQARTLARAQSNPAGTSLVNGIRVVQLNAEQCFPQAELRVEIESMDHVARGDDVYAMLRTAIRIWRDCPSVTWTSYKVFYRDREIRSGEGRRGTRLTSKNYVSLEWQQAYEHGRRTGIWKAELQEERDGWIGVPQADFPITDEQWVALRQEQKRVADSTIARQRGETDRLSQRQAEMKAAMASDSSGLAPFSNQSCHGLKQFPRNNSMPTERDICEAVVRFVLENPRLDYKLQLPESGFVCASDHPYKSNWPDGIMCDYKIKVPTVTVGSQLSISMEDVAKPAMGWFLVDKLQRPRYPVVFSFDNKGKRWQVHPNYEQQMSDLTRRPFRKLSSEEEALARADAEYAARLRRDSDRMEYRTCHIMARMASVSGGMCGSAPP
jgi:hypothetical protein